MYDESLKTLNLKEVHDLIDLYKYASIEGEKVEFSVGTTSSNKRVITIGIQNGHPRDIDTFEFADGDYFDDVIYPELLAYFTCDDPLGKWDVYGDDIISGFNDTQSGNTIYVDTYKQDFFENINEKVEKVNEKTTYKKTPLTNEDKIWDEIILYAKGRRVMQDFFVGSDLMDEELEKVYEFIRNLSEEKEINIGTSKKAIENNEKYLSDLLKDVGRVRKYAPFYNATIDSINNPGTIKKLAKLVGAEKRIRKRLDLDNEEIKEKIEFAIIELDKVDFFNLRNASIDQFRNQSFIESKPKAIKRLIDSLKEYSNSRKEKYEGYCSQILEYLERKSSNSKKIVKTDLNLEEIVFTNHVEGKEEGLSEKMEEENVEKEIKDEDLEALLVRFSDAMKEQEQKEKEEQQQKEEPKVEPKVEPKEEPKDISKEEKKEIIDIPYFRDIDIATFELINEKYKGKYDVEKLPLNERQVVLNFYILKQRLSDYYNEVFDRVDKMDREEIKEFAKREICLSTMMKIEHKHTDNEKTIEYLKGNPKTTPAGKLLIKNLEQIKKEKNKQVTSFLNELVDFNIAKYEEITREYAKQPDSYNKEKLTKDKDELTKLIVYKMHLVDTYNALLFKKDSLNEQELKRLAECDTRLSKIFEIDAKYIENLDDLLENLKAKQEFMLPSTKVWISALEKEKEKRENKSENLFEIVEGTKEDKKVYDLSINEAYEKALSYSTVNTPATIKINFDNNEKVNVIISNKIRGQDIIILQKEYSAEEIDEVMKLLIDSYLENNEVSYNIKFDIAGTPNSGLILIGDEHRSFNITNAPKEFVQKNKEEIDKKIEKANTIKK